MKDRPNFKPVRRSKFNKTNISTYNLKKLFYEKNYIFYSRINY